MTVACPACPYEFATSDTEGLWGHIAETHPASAERIREATGGGQEGGKRVTVGPVGTEDDMQLRLVRMRDRIDKHDQQRAELIERRNALIVNAREQGLSYRAIAEAVGLTHPQVINIVRAQED